MKKYALSSKLLHCFGSERGEKVTPKLAADMIKASGIREIPINTHTIDSVSDWKDLKLGYGDATWNTVSEFIDLSEYTPLWNINLPLNAKDAILRAEKAVSLGGNYPIKFEVLDEGFRWSNNNEVLKGVDYLVNTDNLIVWPLIAPDYVTFKQLEEWGCEVIRVMGSPISSKKGILKENMEVIQKILRNKKCSVMLDGGIGSISDIKQAFSMGFDFVLVNSWLFSDNVDAVEILKSIKAELSEGIVS